MVTSPLRNDVTRWERLHLWGTDVTSAGDETSNGKIMPTVPCYKNWYQGWMEVTSLLRCLVQILKFNFLN